MSFTLSCLSDGVDLKSQLAVNSGITVHAHAQLGRFGIPKSDWRMLDSSEINRLTAPKSAASPECFGIADLQAGFGHRLRNIRDALLEALSGSRGGELRAEGRKLIDESIVHSLANLEQFLGREVKKVLNARLIVLKPHLDSSAYNVQSRCFMGLHYDKYRDHQPEDDAVFQLYSVNLGLTERFFCFLDLPPKAVSARRAACGQPRRAADDSITGVSALLESLEHEPVYRITLEPFQAYLVPTQRVIHDGMTNRKGLADVVLYIACMV